MQGGVGIGRGDRLYLRNRDAVEEELRIGGEEISMLVKSGKDIVRPGGGRNKAGSEECSGTVEGPARALVG